MGLRNGNLSNVSVELPGITLGIRGFFSVNLLINNGMYFSVNLLMTINQSQVTISLQGNIEAIYVRRNLSHFYF